MLFNILKIVKLADNDMKLETYNQIRLKSVIQKQKALAWLLYQRIIIYQNGPSREENYARVVLCRLTARFAVVSVPTSSAEVHA